jgi:hypothetical protein
MEHVITIMLRLHLALSAAIPAAAEPEVIRAKAVQACVEAHLVRELDPRELPTHNPHHVPNVNWLLRRAALASVLGGDVRVPYVDAQTGAAVVFIRPWEGANAAP